MLITALGLFLYLPTLAESLADSLTRDSPNNAVSDSDYSNSNGTMTSEERTEKYLTGSSSSIIWDIVLPGKLANRRNACPSRIRNGSFPNTGQKRYHFGQVAHLKASAINRTPHRLLICRLRQLSRKVST